MLSDNESVLAPLPPTLPTRLLDLPDLGEEMPRASSPTLLTRLHDLPDLGAEMFRAFLNDFRASVEANRFTTPNNTPTPLALTRCIRRVPSLTSPVSDDESLDPTRTPVMRPRSRSASPASSSASLPPSPTFSTTSTAVDTDTFLERMDRITLRFGAIPRPLLLLEGPPPMSDRRRQILDELAQLQRVRWANSVAASQP